MGNENESIYQFCGHTSGFCGACGRRFVYLFNVMHFEKQRNESKINNDISHSTKIPINNKTEMKNITTWEITIIN